MLFQRPKLGPLLEYFRNPVEYNLEPYQKVLDEINRIKLHSASDSRLKQISQRLKGMARCGVQPDALQAEGFAVAAEAARRIVGMIPFDVQVLAGLALQQGKIVEMQTGEGKTLAAVMPAYLNGLSGQGVHVLTFNDYLAARDARWMGPVYEFLGLTVSHVTAETDRAGRKRAYAADITYLTAKEAGFDYLRDFLCQDKRDLVQRSFHWAIVDEADSILIDEARVPLVIAGKVPEDTGNRLHLARIARELRFGRDYETDSYGHNVYLTDSGLARAEKMLGCGNLYAPNNLELLTMFNSALHAEVLLHKDKDYIVRKGVIEIVDELTGRVAERRSWPDQLQAAVEAKEGLLPGAKGMILGSIALQHFLCLYPHLAGMTGTARQAAGELRQFYGLDVVVIPRNKPCSRRDYPDRVFTGKQSKNEALVREIKTRHKTGQPILVGTGSVEESELLAAELYKAGVKCQILNAKNDALEAAIIARAGERGSVTVSTNMAGRGVDIKLGGESEQDKAEVVQLGGLYVIGTNLQESRRVDAQLRGRAGRQGDPGESRFFLSLEDDLVQKYELAKLIPDRTNQRSSLERDIDSRVGKVLRRGQRIVEGYNSDLRAQLWKYSFLVEQQRKIIQQKRLDMLLDQAPLQLLANRAGERYFELCQSFGPEVLQKVEKQLTLYCINKCWAEHLDYLAYVREGIHLVVLAKESPLDEYHKLAIQGFQEMLARIDCEIVDIFNRVNVQKDGIDLETEGLSGPSSTWTYLMKDSPDQFTNISFLVQAAKRMLGGPWRDVNP